MENRVLNEIIKLNLKGCRIAVACSGGSDSMALLHCLNKLKGTLSLKLFAIHVNHNIRGNEAKRDEQFVENYCKNNGIGFILKSVNAIEFSKANKQTLEQGARNLRYNAFNEAIEENGLDYVCLAHNKLDQAETILMHIGRGSGLTGLVGMSAVSGKFLRPILNVSKLEILEYLKQNNVPNIEDSTNESDEYTRNFVRHKLLPTYQTVYPNIVDNLVALSELAKTDLEYINSQIPNELIISTKQGILLKNEAKDLHISLLSRAIRECFCRCSSLVDVEIRHIELIAQMFDLQVGKVLNMPNNTEVARVYDGLLFSVKNCSGFEKVEQKFELGTTQFCDLTIKVESVKKSEVNHLKNGVLYADLNKIPANAVWRTYKSGDVFTKFGGGTKSLKDYFVSKKISAKTRNELPILCDGNTCLLIAGVEISEHLKIDEKTKSVVRITI